MQALFFFFYGNAGSLLVLYNCLFQREKKFTALSSASHKKLWMPTRGGARNFCLGGPICVANLLVYTNFYIHTQKHVSIHTHTKLVSFIMNP